MYGSYEPHFITDSSNLNNDSGLSQDLSKSLMTRLGEREMKAEFDKIKSDKLFMQSKDDSTANIAEHATSF